MNINELHDQDKGVSAKSVFKNDGANAISIHLKQGGQLKEHSTDKAALLICITGQAVFENEKGMKEVLFPGDYVLIEATVKHWLDGISDSQLVLVK